MFNNSCVLVTGASRGIGFAIAKNFGHQGAFIIATATSDDACLKLATILQEDNIQAKVLKLDLGSTDSIANFLLEVKELNRPVDVLINNAGITRDNISLRMKASEWDDVLATNLSGTFKLTQGILKGMLRASYGRIISISSVVAVIGNPGQANYCAAKAGLIGMSKALAQEVASRHITINIIAPGFIETDMTKVLSEEQRAFLLNQIPSKKLGIPDDIAHACLFLASPQAHYITGQTLHVNGGLYMQ
ncbi:3-oxoacyl-[acyl-carrier-protein] reductase [bacterium]|jgi:3-oxoacyl-[acyl-carrier protein] reductase|nr:3-oxoacyl-[acyl-carrier-protein] reductase [bacterium]NBX72359.1 3-oxoacyl-[acyl-carrier-protein] reductase [bacterium]